MTKTSYERFFTALSGNRRLEILQYLQKSGPKSVNDIASGTGIEQSAVSHNLKLLLECEFVHIEVRGKNRFYWLNEDTIVPLLKLIDKHIERFCNGKCDCYEVRSGSVKKQPEAANRQKISV